MSDRKAVIKNADMSEEMQQVQQTFTIVSLANFNMTRQYQDAVDCATEALEKYNVEKDIASFIKKEMDKKQEIYSFSEDPICMIMASTISVQIQSNVALHCGTQLWLLRDP